MYIFTTLAQSLTMENSMTTSIVLKTWTIICTITLLCFAENEIRNWEVTLGTDEIRSHVTATTLSPDEKYGISCIYSSNSSVKAIVWDMENGDSLFSLEGHTSTINAVAFSPDGKKILTGSHDSTAIVWDSKTGKRLYTIDGHKNDNFDYNSVVSVAFSPDGSTFATASRKSVKLWDNNSGTLIKTIDGCGHVTFFPDGKRILTMYTDEAGINSYWIKMKIWDIESGEVLKQFGEAGDIGALALSPDGTTIATGDWSNSLKLWDVESGQMVTEFRPDTFFYFDDVCFTSEGNKLLTSSNGEGQPLTLWNISKENKISKHSSFDFNARCVTLTSDNKTILAGGPSKVASLKMPKLTAIINTPITTSKKMRITSNTTSLTLYFPTNIHRSQIQLFTTSGRLVKSYSMQNGLTHTLDIKESFSKGIYLYRISSENSVNIVTGKISL